MNRLGRNFRRDKKKLGNTPDFHAPLTHNLLLTKGQGVATFTRTTSATVKDFEDLIKVAKSGEARFQGARGVENLVSSELTTWTKSNFGGAVAPVVTVSATINPYDATHPVYSVILNRGAGDLISYISAITYSAFTMPASSIGVTRIAIKGTAGEKVAIRTFSGAGYTLITFTGDWQIFSHSETGSTPNFSFVDRGTVGSTRNVTFEVAQVQLEKVTGQANKNPSEYVSNGVPVGLIGNELVTNGTFNNGTTGWTGLAAALSVSGGRIVVAGTSGVPANQVALSEPLATSAGKKYVLTFSITELMANAGSAGVILNGGTFSTGLSYYYPSAVGTYSNIFTANSSQTLVSLHAGTQVGVITSFDNVSIKEIVFHGAGVDGVKSFDTYNGNTVDANGVVTEATGAKIPEVGLKGVMIETASTNEYLNSETLVTQNNTTTAQSYTISFYGTGSITLSGTASGTLTGTGANNRVDLTVVASAGTLTSTVSGSVKKAQLEAKPMATSYIPTTTTSITRNADVLTFPNAGSVSDTQGTVLFSATPLVNIPNNATAGAGKQWLLNLGNATGLYIENHTLKLFDGSNTVTLAFIPLAGTTYKIALSYGSAGLKVYLNGVSASGSFDGSMNLGTNLTVGGSSTGTTMNWNGTIKDLVVYKQQLTEGYLLFLTT